MLKVLELAAGQHAQALREVTGFRRSNATGKQVTDNDGRGLRSALKPVNIRQKHSAPATDEGAAYAPWCERFQTRTVRDPELIAPGPHAKALTFDTAVKLGSEPAAPPAAQQAAE
jgi:hypothetical protein